MNTLLLAAALLVGQQSGLPLNKTPESGRLEGTFTRNQDRLDAIFLRGIADARRENDEARLRLEFLWYCKDYPRSPLARFMRRTCLP
jgi:hypothetical protein